ncbi:MAG: hypothetical protein PWR01_2621 [Clostridiales bacterium]|nr:hypothetical protein [Clostridiales bacterium]MDN5281548.1 hypothetical protein [Candidatus Ozemobacter sp.]
MKFLRGLLLLFLCLTAMTGFAADVAMVVSGMAQAQLGDESWSVELAEMLPANVVLTIGPDGSLKLIHLVADQEYELPASSTALVTDEGVDCKDVSGTSIELVSADIELGKDMNQQAGTAMPDRKARQAAVPAGSFRPSRVAMPKTVALPEPMPEMAISDEEFNSVIVDESKSSEPLVLQKPKSFKPVAKEEVMPQFIAFAIPEDVADKFDKVDKNYIYSGSEGLQLLGYESLKDWVLFRVNVADLKAEEFELKFASGMKDAVVKFANLSSDGVTMLDAVKLENKGLLYHAAGAWFVLAKKYSISDRVLENHLKRLSEKILNR